MKWKWPEAARRWKGALGSYSYVLLVIAVGAALLLLPTGGRDSPGEDTPTQAEGASFDLDAFEAKLERVLSQVEGAGEVTVALTVKNGTERVPLTDRSTAAGEREDRVEEKAVVINTGSGQQTVVRLERAPVFQGAVVVSQGGDRAEVRLLLTQAVSSLTGLGADKITICKGG